MKVKNLYALLETVLDFMGLAMIRQDDNLVAIVPVDRALQNQPELVDSINEVVKVGDTIVTRVFNIKYVDISDVIALLQNMKLSISSTALENNNLLLVTCHAGRMNRVEQLVNMIDQPGRTLECRLRRLYHTIAPSLVAKIRTMAQELNGITIATASSSASVPKPPVTTLTSTVTPAAAGKKKSVFIDVDERTNRILIIGYKEELSLIEEIIDVLDVAQTNPRSAGIYNIRNISASQALEKLLKLDIIKTAGTGAPGSSSNPDTNINTQETLVIVLEATNQLLVRAVPDQHARIKEFLNYIDVSPGSEQALFAYELKNIKAETAKKILEGLNLTGISPVPRIQPSGPNDSCF